MNDLDRILTSDSDVSPSTALLSSVMENVRFERRRAERNRPFWPLAVIGAVGAALCTVLTLAIISIYN